MYVVLLTTSGVFLGTKTVTNIDPLPPPSFSPSWRCDLGRCNDKSAVAATRAFAIGFVVVRTHNIILYGIMATCGVHGRNG